ncbi:S-adenosyl-L-methionine-dependent methyltransferase [Conidiobolus coronatus NRRL 28638]|uniref:S-adenosyl-L-methionine-dependent methyltransferase n=1 Tax=Conidiobolus coronatus (strain ATCC 28846 / CBS 209.66 / NRRL 28638) TaxID=796925 RepID=A0A137P0N6_CONC2|nr:S-adenosyl-L-methionine-dependent methyltransferase [Conidiobolus coronatus NRRL 28638]|eukprot:KXN68615.1 S-adenosyl-L-methionine-dependent methyltransferase [Conidiobolus coronatus NRRL 28638]
MAAAQMKHVRVHSSTISPFDQSESVSKSMKDYNKSSSTQLGIIKRGLDNIAIAVPNLPQNQGCLQVVDFGCSQGKNSIFVINNLLDEMQLSFKYIKAINKLTVYHVDLPDNDFDGLRDCLIDPNISYLNHNLVKSRNIDVKVECVGKTYYDQILDNNSVDMAFCYSSLHWMPEYTSTPYGLAYDSKYEDYSLTEWFTEMSDRYLAKWLGLRFSELKQYGVISFNIMTYSDCSNWINPSWKRVFQKRSLNYLDFAKVYIPIYMRSTSSIRRVLDNLKDQFKILSRRSESVTLNLPRSGIRSVFFNQIMVGLSKYPEYFKTEASKQQFYYEFEAELFKDSEIINTNNSFEWVVLQKL